MTRYTKMLSLFGIAVVAPMAFSAAASAQYRIEQPKIELTPNCQLIDCEIPRVIPRPPVIPVPCDPRVCDPIEFEPVERPEFERPEFDRFSKPVLRESRRPFIKYDE